MNKRQRKKRDKKIRLAAERWVKENPGKVAAIAKAMMSLVLVPPMRYDEIGRKLAPLCGVSVIEGDLPVYDKDLPILPRTDVEVIHPVPFEVCCDGPWDQCEGGAHIWCRAHGSDPCVRVEVTINVGS